MNGAHGNYEVVVDVDGGQAENCLRMLSKFVLNYKHLKEKFDE